MAELLIITRRELRQLAMRQGVALGALEKDYILTLILRHLYAEEFWREALVFKGGTALHKLYLGRRLSLDLDFTAHKPIDLEAIRPVLEIPEIRGRIREVRAYHDALTIDRLSFVGPLQHPNSVKIDISLREKVQLAPRRIALTTPYGPSFLVPCMALEEILAEKVRAVLMRRVPRDYFDLWLLLQREDIPFAALPGLIRAKLDTVGRPYTPHLIWEEADALKRLWDDDLRQLMRDVPPFDVMFDQLRTLFEEKVPDVGRDPLA
ncbi:MAG: nucleotidyl transferase AbiEii/AbiGii toxin family protein [Anaerolineae bacterium]|nr:nucleotidyl transferase AbiEii/AbiGii toxin family protein [Anaerolineae bacterium]